MRYKFIHLFYRNEVKFNRIILDIINDPTNGFDNHEHLFVAPYPELFEQLKCYPNVILDMDNCNLINKYSLHSDYIITHSYKDVKDFLFAKRKNLRKVVYRYWGGGILPFRYKKGEYLKNIVKRILNHQFKIRLSNLKAIGIANIVDEIDIRKTLPTIPLYTLAYVDRKYSILKEINLVKKNEKSTQILNVMIGHRGGVEGNHIQLIEKLDRFGKRINMYLPLSYGDSTYIKELKEYLEKKDLENVFIIDGFMEYKKYVQMLNEMDVCLFDGQYSYALGNITIVLSLGKKIYLNDKGALADAFKYLKIPYYDISTLNTISLEEFSKPVIYDSKTIEPLCNYNYENVVNQWKTMFNSLNDLNN